MNLICFGNSDRASAILASNPTTSPVDRRDVLALHLLVVLLLRLPELRVVERRVHLEQAAVELPLAPDLLQLLQPQLVLREPLAVRVEDPPLLVPVAQRHQAPEVQHVLQVFLLPLRFIAHL